MKRQFKLIKKFPGSPEVGTIFTKDIGFRGYTYHPFIGYAAMDVESNPEYFAEYKTTTEDGVDIYLGDELWITYTQNTQPTLKKHQYPLMFPKGPHYKYFSTREAAQQYLDSLKPKFEKGEWLIMDCDFERFGYKFLLKYSHGKDNKFFASESYCLNKVEGFVDYSNDTNGYGVFNFRKASNTEIEEFLSEVAKHKGFKEGVMFESANGSNNKWVCYGQVEWSNVYKDVLHNVTNEGDSKGCIYVNGNWAKIIEDVPTKELTITVDGNVVNTSHWNNNVKIVYK